MIGQPAHAVRNEIPALPVAKSCEHKLSVNLVAVPDVDHRAKEGYLDNLMDNIALKKEKIQASDLSMVNDVSENGYMFCTIFSPPLFLLWSDRLLVAETHHLAYLWSYCDCVPRGG